jgi:hypothetical protein
MDGALDCTVMTGPETLEVVGESQYQRELWDIVGVQRDGYIRAPVSVAVLVAETDNPYDADAVSVWIAGRRVGYIARDQAGPLRRGLFALTADKGRVIALSGTIVGGRDEQHPMGMLGVFLDWDPVDFRMASPLAHREPGRMRTGLSEAAATDLGDDSYDLGWMDVLPAEPVRRIGRLRALLETATEPISRHYQHELLVRELYRRRDRSGDDMVAFDLAAEAHHGEMPELRRALVAKFDGVPLVETYRFASIRHAKSSDWEAAIGWCERGLAIYAEEAIRADAIEDLQARAARCWRRLHPDHPAAEAHRAPANEDALTGIDPYGSDTAFVVPRRTVGAVEVLTCQRCGSPFERAVVRGRKPHLCPECRSSSEHAGPP